MEVAVLRKGRKGDVVWGRNCVFDRIAVKFRRVNEIIWKVMLSLSGRWCEVVGCTSIGYRVFAKLTRWLQVGCEYGVPNGTE